jgi:hypothetical protein
MAVAASQEAPYLPLVDQSQPVRLLVRALEGAGRKGGGEVEEGAAGSGDGDVVVDGAIEGVEGDQMSGDAPGAAASGGGDVNDRPRGFEELEHESRGQVAPGGFEAAGEHPG